MSLRLNDVAPDFTAETTQGTIHFHEWIGDNWAVLFSHPKDFTPVCTTELGAVAGLEKQFAEGGAKVIGLSVDKVGDHTRWLTDIQDEPNYLRSAFCKLFFQACNSAELGSAYGCKVLRVGEEHSPVIADPLMKMDRALGGFCRKVWSNIIETK